MKILWKPLLHRAVTGQWERFEMVNRPVPYPGIMKNPGLYLHVPFCRELCPYCPYNRIEFREDKFQAYLNAVCEEISLYARNTPEQEYSTLYIGGGTPTVSPAGLMDIVYHIKNTLNFKGDICIELHPSEMEDRCLELLKQAGVTMLSIGVETTDDGLLKLIGRRHDGRTAVDATRRALASGFDSVNVDLMFALPTQNLEQLKRDIDIILDAGVDQISTYPIFGFPYTELGEKLGIKSIRRPPGGLVREMFNAITENSYGHGMKRCAVWSFMKPEKKKFSSITRHHYVGFGPSAASMTGGHFHVNTFSVSEYSASLPVRRPVALSMRLTPRQEMSYWLYWRVYEMSINANNFRTFFGKELDGIFGHLLSPARVTGLIRRTEDGYSVDEKAAYWIHRVQNEYSLNYINRLWGLCRRTPWPEKVTL